MLKPEVLAGLKEWLATLSPPRSMAGNEAAMRMELETLAGTIERAGVDTREALDRVFHNVKMEAETRSWPTPKELIRAASLARGDTSQDPGRGDRSKLSHDELVSLENTILPTARRWLGIPGLAEHGEKTLTYWNETPHNAQ